MSFVGRAEELTALLEALESAAAGRAVLVVVEGEAGIGKSTLVAEATRRWQRVDGRDVLRAKADELGSAVAFSTLASALGVPIDSATRAVDAVEEMLAANGGEPVVLVLDDAQWLDPATSSVLERVLDVVDDRPFGLVLPIRPIPHPRELAALVTRGPRTTHVVLGAMSAEELAALVDAAVPGVAAVDVPLGQSGGNPMYAVELARATEAERAGTSGHAPPLALTILRRLSYLGDDTLAVLRRAALLGSACSLADLIRVTDVPPGEVVSGVRMAMKAGVLHADGDHVRFSHDLVRQALYEDAPLAVRRYEHGVVGAALADAGAPSAQVATHLELAASTGDEGAIEWLLRAAGDASTQSPASTIDWLNRALALGPKKETRDLVVSHLATQYGAAGRFDELVEMTTRELDDSPSLEHAVTLTISRAQAMTARGQSAAAATLLEQLASTIGAGCEGGTALRARLAGMLASVKFTAGDATGAAVAAEEGVRLATEVGLWLWVAQSTSIQAWLALGRGDVVAGLELAAEGQRLLPRQSGPAIEIAGTVAYAAACTEADRLNQAIDLLGRAVRISEQTAAAGNATLAHIGLALAEYAAGRLETAAVEAESTLAVGATRGTRVADLYALALVARVALHHGDLNAAEQRLAIAEAQMASSGPGLGAELVVWVRALLEESATGTVSPATLDLALLVWQFHPLRFLVTWRMFAPDLVRWLVADGRSDAAITVRDDVDAAIEFGGIAPARGVLRSFVDALVATDAVALGDLASQSEAGPRPLEHAAYAALAGRALLATDRPGGIDWLRRALAVYDSLGASADVTQILDLARRNKVRLARTPRAGAQVSSPSGSAASDPTTSLTPAEDRVAVLAATGLTNRAIGAELAMSRHTVDTHLRHVYRKLGLASRVELAGRFRRGGN